MDTYDLGNGILVLLAQSNSLLYCDFVERVHAELDILVDTLAVRCDSDLDGYNTPTVPKQIKSYICQYARFHTALPFARAPCAVVL